MSEMFLNFDGPFRSQFQNRAIDMRFEQDALVGEFPCLGEAENLISAAVGEYRPRPVHEAVQATQFGDQGITRPQGQMISVAEKDFRTKFVKLMGREAFDRSRRADRHEHRSFHHTVGGGKFTKTGGLLLMPDLEADGHRYCGRTGLIAGHGKRKFTTEPPQNQ